MKLLRSLAAASLACVHGLAAAADIHTLDPVQVTGSPSTDTASDGTVSRRQLDARLPYRPGDILESVPGLVVTQHSGEGKANQYFLRGFNLDHGSDFAVSVDGVPVNMRTHAHGQGYADLNFLIPELVSAVRYRKGPYYAEQGDFSAAGAANVQLFGRLDQGIAELSAGGYGYRRALLAGSPARTDGRLLYAFELVRNDGPWSHPDDLRKVNAVLRYAGGNPASGFDITAMAYRGQWNATDQIARRAVSSGSIGRFDAPDASDGGSAHRYALSGTWRTSGERSASALSAYVVSSALDLFSNFTYFLNDPVNGDQIEQKDKRVLSGVNLEHTWVASLGGREIENRIGVQLRNDNIHAGLLGTRARERISTTRLDHVVESSAGLHLQSSVQLAPALRAVAGARADVYRAEVESDNALNSGKAADRLVSPKLSVIAGPWANTEYYVSYGRGFHSNDARGATITLDPTTGSAAQRLALLVRATGYEVGARSELVRNLKSTFALFRLDSDSELLFVGDAGTTEPSRSSRRTGFELSNVYTPTSWLMLDADIAYSHARFTGFDPAGNRIPGAVEGVATFTAAVDKRGPYYASLRLRYFGPRPLVEDNSVRSASTTLVSTRVGYRFDRRLRAQVDIFNLLDARSSQIDYYYASRLQGETAPVNDVHFHPVERRSIRASLIASF